ncbi:GNAT family N-acetyltransferase [Limoniibacter endophyticus]|uniref:N-acetyltransferase n=1 Tax=Limoniibacter endophyticus TaxID=1565040 RepID=A0A8J3DKU5_9HYPH|nr:GNAT family N-acetyltransferase [Limoniibacter endophyticus]GHC61904.1 N-acetyltransferase [Limoniibacter endophyticus]
MALDDRTPEPVEVTVTFLEMVEPAKAGVPQPIGRNIALLKANGIPLHFYRYLIDRVGRRWHWVNMLRKDDEALAAILHAKSRDIRVLYLDGAPAGFFELHVDGHEVELAFFGMMDHAMGQGLGKWFLGAAISTAWAHHPKRVVVQTCTLDHPAALPLYQKLGFRPYAQANEIIYPLSLAERAQIVIA